MAVYHGRRWRRLRLRVLRRDFYRCRECGLAGVLEVDHIRALADGGDEFDPANLQALCRGCHIAKTRRENQARRVISPRVLEWREVVRRVGG